MTYTNHWTKGRNKLRAQKLESLLIILKSFEHSEHFEKLDNLVELYFESYDLVSEVGLEIAKIIDTKYIFFIIS